MASVNASIVITSCLSGSVLVLYIAIHVKKEGNLALKFVMVCCFEYDQNLSFKVLCVF